MKFIIFALIVACLATSALGTPLKSQKIIYPAGCPVHQVVCLAYCQYGPALDENGCPKACGCAFPQTGTIPTIQLPKTDIVIVPTQCKPCLSMVVCQSGVHYDSWGCRICGGCQGI